MTGLLACPKEKVGGWLDMLGIPGREEAMSRALGNDIEGGNGGRGGTGPWFAAYGIGAVDGRTGGTGANADWMLEGL